MWDVQTGRELFSFKHPGPVRGVAWAEGGHDSFATITTGFGSTPASAHIFTFAATPEQQERLKEPRLSIPLPGKRVPTTVNWLPLNVGLVVTFEDGGIVLINAETGEIEQDFPAHEGKITSLSFNATKTLAITSSSDETARLWDVSPGDATTALLRKVKWLESKGKRGTKDGAAPAGASGAGGEDEDFYDPDEEDAYIDDSDPLAPALHSDAPGTLIKPWVCLREYQADTPLNGAAIAPSPPADAKGPKRDHVVIIGGGQEAINVALEAAARGKFETRFVHMIFGKELGRVRGHFGPVNTLAFNPDGRSYASGGEDGLIRVHHLDAEFDGLKLKEEDKLMAALTGAGATGGAGATASAAVAGASTGAAATPTDATAIAGELERLWAELRAEEEKQRAESRKSTVPAASVGGGPAGGAGGR